jgi:glycosyltransferase involved in cell wall biosynthesis
MSRAMAEKNRAPRGAVLVLGMHRSGTSALARGLAALGVDLGDNLKPPVAGDNDKGFFEDWVLSRINDELLALFGGQWDSLLTRDPSFDQGVNALKLRAMSAIAQQFNRSRYFGFKDPRSCRVVPFWKDVLARLGLEPFYVIAFRNPMSVARSLERRDGFPRARSYYLWLLHTLSAVRHTVGERRVFIDYDDLMAAPEAVLEHIAQAIGDPVLGSDPTGLTTYANEFLDPELRHHRESAAGLDLDDECPPAAMAVFDLLRAEVESDGAPDPTREAAWARQLAAFDALAPHSVLMDRLDRSLRATRADLARSAADLERLQAETSEQRTRIERLQRRGLELESGRTQVEEQLAAASARLAEREAQLAAASAQATDREAQLRTELAAEAEQVAQQRAQAADLAQNLLAVEQALAARVAEIETLEARLRSQDEAGERERERTGRELQALIDAHVRDRQGLIDEIEAARARIDRESCSASERIEQLARERGLLQERLREAGEAVRRAETQAAAQLAQHRREFEAASARQAAAYEALAQRLREVYASTSWRLAAPLRAAKTLLTGAQVNETVPDLPAAGSAQSQSASAAAPAPTMASAAAIAPGRRVHFTICAKNYLPIARACLESSKRFHPEAEHVLVLCDEVEQGYDPAKESFRVVQAREIEIPSFADMALRYDVMELSTAVKPFCFKHFFADGADETVYLDPDLFFLAPLDEVRAAFAGGAEAVLTPHITRPIEDDKLPGDADMLRSGVYNLGFLALRRAVASEQFVGWWGERLRTAAVSDIRRGFFTDQKWCDLLPSFIRRTHICYHPGYNLAYWNLMHRPVHAVGGRWTAAGEPIVFAHFSGASFTDRNVFSKHQNRFDYDSMGELRGLYDLYRDEVRSRGMGRGPDYRYAYDWDADGRRIALVLRRLYRDEMAPSPRATRPSLAELIAFANAPAHDVKRTPGLIISRLMHRVWSDRPDLHAAFDLGSEQGQRGFIDWWRHSMERELGLDERFLPGEAASGGETPAEETQPANAVAALSRTVLAHVSSLRPVYQHLPAGMRQRVKTMLTKQAFSASAWAAPNGAAAQDLRPGAALIGYARGELGMGEHVRMTAAALHSRGVSLGVINITENVLARQQDRRFDHLLVDGADFGVNIFHINADQLPVVCSALGEDRLAGKWNIAYPAWELSKFPQDWTPQLDAMSEIWAPSRFIQEALAGSVETPVLHMPLAVELAEGYEKWRREHFGLPADAFVFLFYFDLASFASRKNPMAVIEAYRMAAASLPASAGAAAMLVVKVISAERFPEQFAQLRATCSATPGIVLIPDVFDADKMHGLVNCADAFVSLHRSEGFGRGPAEAMRLGKATIATGYSGNMDYMDGANSFPVSYRLKPVGPGEYPYGEGQHWAEPDVGEAAAIMRRLIEDRSLARERGERARAHMQAHHSVAAVGKRYAERLIALGAWAEQVRDEGVL